MTKWKSVQVKDEGEVIEDIIDPEAHKTIKTLNKVIRDQEEELEKSHEHEDETHSKLHEAFNRIEQFKAEADEKDTKISWLATKMNELLITEHKLHTEIRKLKSEMCNRWSSVEDVTEDYKRLESQFRLMQNEISKYRTMEEKARSENYDKEFIRKLRQLLRSL
jgi:chromosome segregation ATPase